MGLNQILQRSHGLCESKRTANQCEVVMKIYQRGYRFIRVSHNKDKSKWFVERLFNVFGVKFWWRISTMFRDEVFAENFVKYEIMKSE